MARKISTIVIIIIKMIKNILGPVLSKAQEGNWPHKSREHALGSAAGSMQPGARGSPRAALAAECIVVAFALVRCTCADLVRLACEAKRAGAESPPPAASPRRNARLSSRNKKIPFCCGKKESPKNCTRDRPRWSASDPRRAALAS